MSANVEFTTFDGWLKQVRSGDLNDTQRSLISKAFPLFMPRDPMDERNMESFNKLKDIVDYFVPATFPPRRFAGDEFLGRGRYHSVANDESGNDYCCLANELHAYRNPSLSYAVEVLDPSDSWGFSELSYFSEKLNILKNHIYISLISNGLNNNDIYYDMPHLRVKAGDTAMAIYWFPTYTSKYVIENCVDLRLPCTRDWFYQTFKKGDGKIETSR